MAGASQEHINGVIGHMFGNTPNAMVEISLQLHGRCWRKCTIGVLSSEGETNKVFYLSSSTKLGMIVTAFVLLKYDIQISYEDGISLDRV